MVSGLEILGGFGSVVSKSIQNIVLTIIQDITKPYSWNAIDRHCTRIIIIIIIVGQPI